MKKIKFWTLFVRNFKQKSYPILTLHLGLRATTKGGTFYVIDKTLDDF